MLKNAATSASFFFSLFMNSWISAISVHLANIHIYIYLLFPCSSDFDCNSRFYENAPGEVECLDLIHQTHQMFAIRFTKTLNQTQDLIFYHAGANQNKTYRSCKLVFMRLFTTKPNPNRGFSLSNLTSDACLRYLFYHLGRLI